MDVVHYDLPGYIAVHGKGKLLLELAELEHPIERFDGKKASFELSAFELSQECANPDDQAWACVRNDDYLYLTKTEGKALKRKLDEGKTLHDCYQFFP